MLILAIALTAFSIGSYLVWPSRWNIPGHINLGFALTAYIVPIFFTDLLNQYPRALLDLYESLIDIGAGFYVIGIVCGGALPRFKFFWHPFAFVSLSDPALNAFVSRRVVWLALFSIAGMAISFKVMGFIPMFAIDPMLAKYLRGTYQDTYRQVAPILRSSEQIIIVTMPLVVMLFYITRRKLFIVIGALQFALQSMTLNRGMLGAPILVAIGLIAVSRGYKAFIIYFLLVVFAVAAASASTYYAARLLIPQLIQDESSSVAENIASGTPDLSDTLKFLIAFERKPEWTYGRTFLGGLVPFHYHWNPSVWSLWVEGGDDQMDVNDTISGGLRLPPPVIGYTAFGWPGAIIVCLLSGLALGYATAFARVNVGAGSLIRSMLALTIYGAVALQLSQFYAITLYSIFSLLVALIFAYPVRLSSAPEYSEDLVLKTPY